MEMTTHQGETLLPQGEQQPALPVFNYIEAFRPLVPTEEMHSTSQRLQHIFVTNGSPASFGQVVSKQWRADCVNSRRTWAVVGTAREVRLLEQDLISGAATDVPGQSIHPKFVTALSFGETISGRGIVIMTFDHLVAFLAKCFQEDRTWQWDATWGSPTVVMNFGWGNMSFEMAFACPLLARLIEDTMQTSPQVVMACTVSSDDRPYFGREWRQVEMQEITALTSGPGRMLQFRSFPVWEGNESDSSLLELGKLLDDIWPQEAGQRTLLVADQSLLRVISKSWSPLEADRTERLRGDDAGDIALHSDMTYIGQVRRVKDMIIYPYTDGCIDDKGQTVWCQTLFGIPRSQAEIYYLSRCNQESEIRPQVHILANEDYFGRLPAHCETSAAHSLHLARLLVCCKYIWPDVPLADIPVLLPANENLVVQQLGSLSARGLMIRSHNLPSEVNPPGPEGSPELHRSMMLTRLGCMTAAILMKGVQSTHSAHLLAQLLDTTREYRTLNKNSGAVTEAVFALSILTEFHEQDMTLLSQVTYVTQSQPGDRAWYNDNLKGISEGAAGRGPIWLTAGLWKMLMNNYELRGPLSYCMRRRPATEIKLNGDSISVEARTTMCWDLRLRAVNQICISLSDMDPVRRLSETPLTAHELLTVEVALVRSFMDRILMVEDHSEDFQAWDLASGHKIDRPSTSDEAQIWWENCRSRDAMAIGEGCPVIFCVYSYVARRPRVTSDGGYFRVKRPVDAIHVSARAVRVAFEGTDTYLNVEDPASYIRLLRERAR